MSALRVPLVVLLAGVLAFGLSCGRSPAPMAAEPPPAAPASAEPEVPAKPKGCGLPPGGGPGTDCPYQRAVYAEDINQAIARVVNEHPDYFDLTQQESTWSFLVKKPDLYLGRW